MEELSTDVYIECSNEPCTNQATFYHRLIIGEDLVIILYFCEKCANLYLRYTGEYDMEALT